MFVLAGGFVLTGSVCADSLINVFVCTLLVCNAGDRLSMFLFVQI